VDTIPLKSFIGVLKVEPNKENKYWITENLWSKDWVQKGYVKNSEGQCLFSE